MVLALVLFLLLLLSTFFNITNLFTPFSSGKARVSRTVGPKLEEVLVEDNSSSSKVAVIPIEGIITSRSLDQSGFNYVDVVKAQFRHAEEDDRVKAVILKVDSPGGEVLASDEIARAIIDFQKQSKKSVIASMGNLAASGGYYVSAPCQWIIANELTITGSIGVIMHSWNYRTLMNKVGLKPETYKSGKFKDMLSGDRDPEEIPAEERSMVQNLIDQTYAKFKGVVASGRKAAADKNKGKGRALSSDWADYADGRILSGDEAYKLGFVDELGNFEDAIKRAQTMAGITNANIVEYQLHYDISDFLRMFGKSEAPVVKVDLGMEPPKLQAGQLYFLSPTLAR